jgi:hypothetical protein
MHQQGSKLDASAGTHNIDVQSPRRAEEEGSRMTHAGLRWGRSPAHVCTEPPDRAHSRLLYCIYVGHH